MYEVAPFGERRADLRAAIMTANLMQMQAKKDITDEEFREVVFVLMKYLPDEDDSEDAADLQALKRLKGRG